MQLLEFGVGDLGWIKGGTSSYSATHTCGIPCYKIVVVATSLGGLTRGLDKSRPINGY